MDRQGFINVALVLLVAAVAGLGTYYVMTSEVKAPMAETQVPVVTSGSVVAETGSCDSGAPVITSLTPTSGQTGTRIAVTGCNFAGFEGDLTAWIENGLGEKGIIYSESGSIDTSMSFVLKPSLCTVDTSYSGIPCPKTIQLTPGQYQVYTYPWGRMSNKVNLIITP